MKIHILTKQSYKNTYWIVTHQNNEFLFSYKRNAQKYANKLKGFGFADIKLVKKTA
jgi:hypothetical protein